MNPIEGTVPETVKKTGRKFETGHAKNVANFETMLSYLGPLGTLYNPSRNYLKHAYLTEILNSGKEKLIAVNIALVLYTDAVTEREVLFAKMKTYTRRIFASLKANEESKATLEDAQRFVHRLNGKRIKALTDEQQESGRYNSVSQSSFDQRVTNFDKLIALLENNENYQPNEEDLKITSIKMYADSLKTANNLVREKHTLLVAARLERDTLLYGPKTGMFDLVKGIKNYLESIMDKKNPLYVKIRKIKLTNK